MCACLFAVRRFLTALALSRLPAVVEFAVAGRTEVVCELGFATSRTIHNVRLVLQALIRRPHPLSTV